MSEASRPVVELICPVDYTCGLRVKVTLQFPSRTMAVMGQLTVELVNAEGCEHMTRERDEEQTADLIKAALQQWAMDADARQAELERKLREDAYRYRRW